MHAYYFLEKIVQRGLYEVPRTKCETAYDIPAFRRPALFLDNHLEEKLKTT